MTRDEALDIVAGGIWPEYVESRAVCRAALDALTAPVRYMVPSYVSAAPSAEATKGAVPLKDWPEHAAKMQAEIRRSEKITGDDLSKRVSSDAPPAASFEEAVEKFKTVLLDPDSGEAEIAAARQRVAEGHTSEVLAERALLMAANKRLVEAEAGAARLDDGWRTAVTDALGISSAFGWNDCAKEIAALKAEAARLSDFKAYVHKRLDDAGIPTHPEGPHSKEGCRIGDRIDLALAEAARVNGVLAVLDRRKGERRIRATGCACGRSTWPTDGGVNPGCGGKLNDARKRERRTLADAKP